MGCTVRELLSRTDARELAEWMAYHKLDPFGQDRADLRAGIVAATVHNVNVKQQAQPADFMPDFTPPEERAGVMLETAKNLALRTGGTVTYKPRE